MLSYEEALQKVYEKKDEFRYVKWAVFMVFSVIYDIEYLKIYDDWAIAEAESKAKAKAKLKAAHEARVQANLERK